MAVDPVLKQDLMLIRDAYKEGALAQDGDATFVPVREMLSTQRQAHQSISKAVRRYPSYYARNQDKVRSFLDRVQQECIPCAQRIKILRDCDIGINIDDSLIQYNSNILKELTNFFRFFEKKGPIETNLCEAYRAFRTQCLPDIRRLIMALTYLLNDIRSFSLKGIGDNFIQVVLAIVANLVVNITFSLDKFAQLITNTLKCVLSDVRTELAKIEPILPRRDKIVDGEPVNQGIRRTQEILQEAWKGDEADKTWLNQQVRNKPEYNEVPFSQQFDAITDDVDRALQRIPSANITVDVGEAITGMVERAITRVDGNLDIATNELLKLFKAGDGNFKALNELVSQIQIITGILNVLKGIEQSRGDFDPCSFEAAEAFFTTVNIPRTRISVNRRTSEDPDNVEIDITPDTTSVDNPIVRDILENAGIEVVEVEQQQGEGAGTSTFEVAADPVVINLSKCLGGG